VIKLRKKGKKKKITPFDPTISWKGSRDRKGGCGLLVEGKSTLGGKKWTGKNNKGRAAITTKIGGGTETRGV